MDRFKAFWLFRSGMEIFNGSYRVNMEILRKVKVENMTLNSAVEFMVTLGFKVSKAKLYTDAKAGKIAMNPDYTVSPAALMSYAFIEKVSRPADAHLTRTKNVQTSTMEKLRVRKLKAETVYYEEMAKGEKRKHLVGKGNLLDRFADVEKTLRRITVKLVF